MHIRSVPFGPVVPRRRPKRTFAPGTGAPAADVGRKRKHVRRPERALFGRTARLSVRVLFEAPVLDGPRQDWRFTNGSCEPSEKVWTSEISQPADVHVGGVVSTL